MRLECTYKEVIGVERDTSKLQRILYLGARWGQEEKLYASLGQLFIEQNGEISKRLQNE